MSHRYKVYLPSAPRLEGFAEGIRFIQGQGIVDESTIDPALGLSVEEVVQKLEAAGYLAEIVKDETTGLAVEIDSSVSFTPTPAAEQDSSG